MIVPVITPTIPVALPTPVAIEPVRRTDTDNKSKNKDSQSENPRQENALSRENRVDKTETRLTEQEKAEVQQLAQRDRDVRAHEAAHKGAAGRYARGGAEFSYTRGPDGRQYATGGEVSIDVSTPDDPREALRKAQIIQRAALAPASPSQQDRAIASQAAKMAAEASADIQKQRTDQQSESSRHAAEQKREDVNQAYTVAPDDTIPTVDLIA